MSAGLIRSFRFLTTLDWRDFFYTTVDESSWVEGTETYGRASVRVGDYKWVCAANDVRPVAATKGENHE